MFGALVLNGVGRHVHSADVVAVNQSSATQRCAKLSEEQAQPGDLSDDISNRTVLGLGTGAGDCILTLGRLGDQVIAQEDCIT